MGPNRERSPILLPGLLLAVSLHAFHAMAVVTVIPQATEELHGRALYGAFFSSYLLASLLGLVWAGGALSRWGPRRVLAISLGVFATGILGSALAPGMGLLVGARALEGFGGGGVSSVLYAIVNLSYAAHERPRVLFWMSSAWVLPGLFGPPVAGLVAESVGWRWVFLGVLPLVVSAAAMTLPSLPPGEPRAATERGGQRSGEGAEGFALLLRAAILAAGVAGVLLGLSLPLGPMAVALTAGSGGVMLAVGRTVLPAGTLTARPGLPAAIASKFLINFSFFGAEAFLPLALRELRDFTLTGAGLVLTCAALSWTTGAFVHSRLAARVAPGALSAVGSAGIGVGIAGILLLVTSDAPGWLAHLSWSLAGLGMGIAYNTATTEAMGGTATGDEGRTSTALGMADALGFALAAGVGGAILAVGSRAGGSTASAIAAICALMAAVVLLSLAISGRLETTTSSAKPAAAAAS